MSLSITLPGQPSKTLKVATSQTWTGVMVGDRMFVPYGKFPNVVRMGDGTVRRVLQVFDKESAETIQADLNSVIGRALRLIESSKFGSINGFALAAPVYIGHPDDPAKAKDWPDKAAYGWVTGMEVSDDGAAFIVKWSPDGENLLSQRKYIYPSPYWSFRVKDGASVSPNHLISIGLCNNPNIPVPPLSNARVEGFIDVPFDEVSSNDANFDGAHLTYPVQSPPNRKMKLSPKLKAILGMASNDSDDLDESAANSKMEEMHDKLCASNKELTDKHAAVVAHATKFGKAAGKNIGKIVSHATRLGQHMAKASDAMGAGRMDMAKKHFDRAKAVHGKLMEASNTGEIMGFDSTGAPELDFRAIAADENRQEMMTSQGSAGSNSAEELEDVRSELVESAVDKAIESKRLIVTAKQGTMDRILAISNNSEFSDELNKLYTLPVIKTSSAVGDLGGQRQEMAASNEKEAADVARKAMADELTAKYKREGVKNPSTRAMKEAVAAFPYTN